MSNSDLGRCYAHSLIHPHTQTHTNLMVSKVTSPISSISILESSLSMIVQYQVVTILMMMTMTMMTMMTKTAMVTNIMITMVMMITKQ